MKYFFALSFLIILNITALNAQNPINFNLSDYQNHQKKIIEKIAKAVSRLQQSKNTNNSMLKDDAPSVTLNEYERIVSDDTQSEAEIGMAINPADSNNLVISPIYQDALNFTKPLTCPVYYSKDFGETWTKSEFSPSPIDKYEQNLNFMIVGGGDPVFAFDANGRLYLSWIYLYLSLDGMQADSIFADMFYAFSDNGGIDWTYDKNCTIMDFETGLRGKYNGESTLLNGRMLDKQWMASDLSDNSQYKGTVYLAALGADLSDSQIQDAAMFIWKKLPGKDYFEKHAVRITPKVKEMQGASLTVDDNGWVHFSCLYSDGDTAQFYHFISKDGGDSFQATGKITDFYGTMDKEPFSHTNNNNTGLNRLYPQNNLVADASGKSPYKNNLYFTWTANGFTNDLNKGFDAYFSRSLDAGSTWLTPYKINNDTTDNQNFYPFLAVSPLGVVCAAWYDRRNDENDAKTDFYLAYSFDGGESFTNNTKISSASTDFSLFTGNSVFGIGEYNMLVATEGWCFAVWADGRKGDGKLDIYVAKVPIRDDLTGVNEVINVNSALNAEVFPNPANDKAILSIYSQYNSDAQIDVVNLSGKTVYALNNVTLTQGSNSLNLDLSSFNPGVYFVKIVSNNTYTVRKFIVK